ncbi:PRC and DUF2382 domain-containing protein [Amycolatopsis sp. PS_44_ISF1]|uniref:PRC and DUF2382 domain-containing protein n=1 Tax=Amycolatopsis sp. PS_44_ISF1 TaxID=2974917 RepID=UPI0028DEEE12|nr:PRC and DUF2382 domain-containing protein [Amycolatopsis sp. PS_44_ISF1]MDT8912407.1 PRC and DUF2382 domain-containing protein [Amycolatopsis sp. PS_44_ISF1]
MARTLDPEQLIGSTAVDRHGEKLGKIGSVYLSDETGHPEWVTVKTGLFGLKESFVPLGGADLREHEVVTAVAKEKVSDAPRVDADGHLSPEQNDELYRYYGLQQQAGPPRAERRDRATAAPAADRRGGRDDRRAGRGDQAEVVRSEERMRVGTEAVPTGRVRLRKYVVTEQQEAKVPLRHEEVRVQREPIENGAPGQGRIEEAEQDVTLYAEKPVVRTETVPVEKIRLNKQQVTEEHTVRGEVRKEQVDVTDDTRR